MALTGDALFTMGCGRVFTGNFAQMQEPSLHISCFWGLEVMSQNLLETFGGVSQQVAAAAGRDGCA